MNILTPCSVRQIQRRVFLEIAVMVLILATALAFVCFVSDVSTQFPTTTKHLPVRP